MCSPQHPAFHSDSSAAPSVRRFFRCLSGDPPSAAPPVRRSSVRRPSRQAILPLPHRRQVRAAPARIRAAPAALESWNEPQADPKPDSTPGAILPVGCEPVRRSWGRAGAAAAAGPSGRRPWPAGSPAHPARRRPGTTASGSTRQPAQAGPPTPGNQRCIPCPFDFQYISA